MGPEQAEPSVVKDRPSAAAFRRNAIIMVAGTAAAQGIAFVGILFFARLFSPEAIGTQAIYVSATGILTTLASTRLDLALVLERTRAAAAKVAGVALTQSVAAGAVIVAGLVISESGFLGKVLSSGPLPGWPWLLPLGVVTGVGYVVGISVANRERHFWVMAGADTLQSATFVIFGLLFYAFARSDTEALATSRLLAQTGGFIALVIAAPALYRMRPFTFRLRALQAVWREHRQFLVYNTPYSLFGSLSRDSPIYLFSALAGLGTSAAYALTRTITIAPVVLFSTAVSRVFYREAIDRLGEPDFERGVRDALRAGLIGACVPFAWLSSWGDELITALIGERWHLSGEMMMLLAPAVWMSLQTGWPERMFEVTRRQRTSFRLQICFDLTHVVVLSTTLFLTHSPLAAVGAFSVSLVTYHISYLFAVHRVASFRLSPLVVDLALGLTCYATSFALLLAVRLYSGGVVGLAVSGAIAVTLTVLAMGYCLRSAKRHARQSIIRPSVNVVDPTKDRP